MAFPAYGVELKAGQTIKPSSPVTYALGGGQVTPYTVITPATPEVEEKPGEYTVTLADGGGVYRVRGVINTAEGVSELEVLEVLEVKKGEDKNKKVIRFGNEGDTFVVIKAPTSGTSPQREKRDPRGGTAIAIGEKSMTYGDKSIAIGDGAKIVRITPATPEVGEKPGEYTVTLADGGGVYRVRGVINTAEGVSELEVLEVLEVKKGEDKNKKVIRFGNEGDTFVVIKAPTSGTSPRREKRDPVERAVAVGAEAKVEGDNGVAIGAGASAKANSIAIGSDVEAGENEIVIGNGKATKVEVGGMDLMGIDKNVAGNRTDIDANTGNITTNAGNIATNSAHISTNVGNIATNTDNIVTNSSNINVNARDILNNKAGIAMAIALAHIPAATGGSRGSVGIGGGFFDGKEAIAIGASFRVGDRGQAKLGISHSSGETGGGVGVGFNF